jgi:hypothetical protein
MLMKKLFSTLIIGSMVLGLFFSCKKDKKEVQEEIIGSMKATIGTMTWEAQEPVGKIKDGFLVITGLRLVGTEKQSIVLNVNALAAGTYDLNKDPLHPPVTTHTAIYSPNQDSTINNPAKFTYTAYSGSIVVTSTAENRATGTFEFKCANLSTDTIHVTSGEFKNIYYLN